MATSIIVPGIKVEGKVSGDSDIKVEGSIVGEIELTNSIYIAKSGKVDADIKALNVFIAGEFSGNIEAKELIQISPGGKVTGEIKAPYISIEKGAIFNGSIDMKNTPDPTPIQSDKTVKRTVEAKAAKIDAEPRILGPCPQPERHNSIIEEAEKTVAVVVDQESETHEKTLIENRVNLDNQIENGLNIDSDY